jgi:NAD-dependent SIR2 family protein deacetylase
MNRAAIEAAAATIDAADALLVAAGAGMGVDSGLPDFRGSQGFWRAYPALGRRGLPFHEVASPETFFTEPRLAWGFYGHRLALYRATAPHAGFAILRRWIEAKRHGGAVFTSNVDGQFQRAGFDGMPLEECHGSIHHLQCSRACGSGIWAADGFVPLVDEERCLLLNDPPACPACGAVARPNILMFGDHAWLGARSQAQARSLEHWLGHAGRPVVVEIGAGTAVPSVRHFSERALLRHGALLVRINPREPGVPRPVQDVSIAGGALVSLLAIDALLP